MLSAINAKNYARNIVLIIFVILMIPPFFFREFKPGLDASWNIALHLAHQNNFVFGKDFVFTYGPLGILYSRHAIAVNKIVYILFDLYFITTLVFFLREIFRKHFTVAAVLLVFFGLFNNMYEGLELWFFFFFLYYLFEWIKEPSKSGHLLQALVLSLISVYIKVNFGIIALIILVFTFVYCLVFKKISRRQFLWWVGGYVLALVLTSYLLNVNLPGYIIGSWHLINDYNDAMFRLLPDEYLGFLIMALIIVGVLAAWIVFRFIMNVTNKEILINLDELVIYGITALFVFILFKSSFVRGHLYIFIKGVSLPLLFFYLHNPKENQRKLTLAVCYVALIVSLWGVNTLPGTYRPLMRIATLQIVPLKWNEIKTYFSGLWNYEVGLKVNPAYQSRELKTIIGSASVDIIPQEISKIFFNDLHYNPRPVIQSYAAYNEYLDNLNYQKYTSSSAPDFIIFSLSSIDDRFPFFDESKTKIAILSNYEIVNQVGSDIIFQKRLVPRKVQRLIDEEIVTAEMNQEIPIKNTSAIQYSKIDIEYSFLGKLKRFFYQPPQCNITFVLEDNVRKTFRAVKPILKSGILVNKFVNNNPEFQLFQFSQGQLDPPVAKIIIETDSAANGFKPTVKIQHTYYSFEELTEAEKSTDNLRIENLLVTLKPKIVDFAMEPSDSLHVWFDEVNSIGQFVVVEGWGFANDANNTNSTIVPVVRGASGVYQLNSSVKDRTDLNIAFGRKDLSHVGFTSIASNAALPIGRYQLGVAIRNSANNSVRVSFVDKDLFIAGAFDFEKTAISSSSLRRSEMETWIDNIKETNSKIMVDGWAFLKNGVSNNGTTNLILKNKDNYFRLQTASIARPDIANHFKNPGIANSGFFTSIEKEKLSAGSYTIGIEKVNEDGVTNAVKFTDKKIKVRVPDYYIPAKIESLPAPKEFTLGINKILLEGDFITVSGWAIDEFKDVDTNTIRVILKHDNDIFICETETLARPDVTAHFKNGYALDDCGFSSKIFRTVLPKGTYQVAIVVQKKNGESYMRWADKFEQN